VIAFGVTFLRILGWALLLTAMAAMLDLCLPACTPAAAPGTAVGTGSLLRPRVHLVFVDRPVDPVLTRQWSDLLKQGILTRLSEYGVQSGELILPSSELLSALQDRGSDLALLNTLNAGFADGSVPSPTIGDIYVLLLPPGVGTLFLRSVRASGYHGSSTYLSTEYAYAPVLFDLDENMVVSHEVCEAAVNPRNRNGIEVGDACEGQGDVIAGVTVQKVWSAKLQPCQ
jgi:hypothetical protein